MSKAGIDYNNKRLEELTQALLENGFMILSYNTDGIWYTHPEGKVYHDSEEGKELGQWKNDHINCKFQAQSCAAYHFIENDKCTTVLSGMTRLDRVKPREEWAWDDLYSKDTKVAKIIFERHKGAKFIYE